MQVELKQMEIVLQEASSKSAVLLQEIPLGTASAEKTKTEVQIVTDTAGNKATVVVGEKTNIEKDLFAVKPVLNVAESSMDAIWASDIKDLNCANPEAVISLDMPDARHQRLSHVRDKLFRGTELAQLHDG
jgi:hypothetical protein